MSDVPPWYFFKDSFRYTTGWEIVEARIAAGEPQEPVIQKQEEEKR